MTGKDLPALSIADLQSLLRRREVSPREVIDALRERIEAVDGDIGAYLSLDIDAAIKEAEQANVDLPLGGVPIAIKDIINVMGQPCTCASKILNGYRAPYDATVIQKLRAAGAIPFGKTNLDEFAMGSSTENSAVKLTRNPWDLSRVPGGSSGGSAAAVAADAAFGALGHRYRRLHSATRCAVRCRRAQTNLWPGLAIRSCRVCFVARSNRAVDKNRTRRCADHERDRRS